MINNTIKDNNSKIPLPEQHDHPARFAERISPRNQAFPTQCHNITASEHHLGLRGGRVRDIMRCMKRICLTGCVIAAFVLSACSQVEQPQPGVGPNPVAPAEEEDTTATGESEKEDEAKDADAEDKKKAEADGEKEHVCSGLMSCKLGLCPNGKKRSEATAANEEQEEEETEDEENITPTEEQMEAARALMAENNKKKKKSSKSRSRATVEQEEYIPQPEPVVVSNTSGIPGRSGLRMGRFAPPEEAISKGDGDSSQPNAAERHGLRSPSLPKSLPMNIDGKTHAH